MEKILKIEINNKNINYDVIGEGKEVILLHGWLANLETMRPIANMLKNNFKCYLVDIVGFGKSDKIEKPMNSDDYGNFIKDFMQALNIENPILIGHSNGGRAIIDAVGRGIVNCEKIVLIDSAGLKKKHSLMWYLKVYTYKLGKLILNIIPQTKYIKETKEEYLKNAGSADYKASSSALKQTMNNILNESQVENCKKIKCPTLLIWGGKDSSTPLYQGKKMEQLIPDSALVVYKDADHFSYLNHLNEVSLVLNSFLRNDSIKEDK